RHKMKAAIGSVVVAAAVFIAGQVPMHAAAPQASTTTRLPDATLAPRIEKRIHDSSLKKYDIQVSVNDGVATLRGAVPTEADRRKAAELATITGVSRVDNQLVVDTNAGTNGVADKAKGTSGKVESSVDKGADKTKAGINKAIDKSAEGAEIAWARSKDGAATVWEKTKAGTAKAADKSAQGASRAGE